MERAKELHGTLATGQTRQSPNRVQEEFYRLPPARESGFPQKIGGKIFFDQFLAPAETLRKNAKRSREVITHAPRRSFRGRPPDER
jgi:hypothetical protein